MIIPFLRVNFTCFFLSFCLFFFKSGFTQSTGTSVYFKNFVRHVQGDLCTHTPPQATFNAYLNNNLDKILVENAPRWEVGGDPNINGQGVFGVELGNFSDPALAIGDSVFFRFTCNETEQQGILKAQVSGVPWYYFPTTLILQPMNIPAPPENIILTIINRQRLIQWDQVPGVNYTVYRRLVSDTVAFGQSRMLYQRIATNLVTNHFLDTTSSVEGHGYIVIPKLGNVYGSHSEEVTDYPATPVSLEAAIAYSQPLTVAVTWIQPGDTSNLHYHIYRSQSPHTPVDSLHLFASTHQFFCLDSSVTSGEKYYYRITAVNGIGVNSIPSEEVQVLAQPSPNDTPDLDILYISRSPKYPRFEVEYDPPGYNPYLKPGTQNLQHYPEVGEPIKYTATIRNSGGATIENYIIHWYADSVLVQSETRGQLFPRQRITSQIIYTWSSDPVLIECEVVTNPLITEISQQNNSLVMRSNALSFHFHAEANILDLFESQQNPMGSYSLEDWAQVQVAKMNQFFRDAVYPDFTPSGVPEFVFLDTVSYYPNGALPAGGTHAPDHVLWDGQWGFTGDANAINYFQNIVLNQNNGMDWALLHELGHQIGLIDLYNMDVQQSELQVIEPRTGQAPPLTPVAWDVLYYSSRHNFLMHSNFQAGFSDHSAGGLLRNLSKRRGYFGDYLADLPAENTFLIQLPNGSPVRNAEIWIYQLQDNLIPNVAKFKGVTDNFGHYTFPHETDPQYSSGLYVDNPFSTICSQAPHVVGTNSVLFLRVTKGDSVGYRFIDICDFNVAFWSGQTANAGYDVEINKWFNMPAVGLTNQAELPKTFDLFQNHPNPFNPETEISYQIPRTTDVNLIVYNLLGQVVKNLVNESQVAGKYKVIWGGRNNQGNLAASGIYIYRLRAGGFVASKKMFLLR
jgi:hypothetical protein